MDYHTGQLTDKSDIYSFGVILAELLTRKKPIIEKENGEKQNLSNYLCAAKEKPLEDIVDDQVLEEASKEAIMCFARLAQQCLDLRREARPTEGRGGEAAAPQGTHCCSENEGRQRVSSSL